MNQLPRHTEAQLERELGQSPLVELRGTLRIQAGRITGIWIGPNDMAEMMRVRSFEIKTSKHGGCIGNYVGISFFMLGEDLP